MLRVMKTWILTFFFFFFGFVVSNIVFLMFLTLFVY